MTDVVQFFLKMATDKNADDLGAPFLLTFGLERSNIAMVSESARPILDAIRASGDFSDDSHAAWHALADVIVGNAHLDPEVQHVMAPLVVYLATDTPAKRESIADGAAKAGFLLSPDKVPPQLTFRFVTAK